VGLAKFSDTYILSVIVYALVGGVCACIEWGSFYLLLGQIDVWLAAFVAFLIATVANCALSRLVAFHSMRRSWQEVGLVFGASAIAFVFNFVTFMLIYRIGYPAMIAKVCGTGAAFVINYSLRQFFVFSRVPRFQSLSSFLKTGFPASRSHEL
jgi:putative flippase GtrA